MIRAYIDLEEAIALIRERGLLGEGYSDTERENDAIDTISCATTIELEKGE